jgi:hypothetical protein
MPSPFFLGREFAMNVFCLSSFHRLVLRMSFGLGDDVEPDHYAPCPD